MNKWTPPAGHPIDEKKAKELIGGDLGKEYRQILQRCCTPIFWYENKQNSSILNNGTVTIVKTPKKLLGVTAAHIVNSYFSQSENLNLKLQIGEELIPDLRKRIIAVCDKLDLATISLEPHTLNQGIVPLTWPPRVDLSTLFRTISLKHFNDKENELCLENKKAIILQNLKFLL